MQLEDTILHYVYYGQTQPFTCGSACLVMALTFLAKLEKPTDNIIELEIWRRANTIYMGKGHPGCGPYGLASLARMYGCDVRILLSHSKHFFKRWNKDPHKRELEFAMERHDMSRASKLACAMESYPESGDAILEFVKPRNVIISLCGGNKIAGGHWTCAVSDGKDFIVMDPYIEAGSNQKTNITKMGADQYHKDMHYLNQRVGIILSNPQPELSLTHTDSDALIHSANSKMTH